MSDSITFHVPVMLREVIEGLAVQEGKKYIDATVGGGGHGVEIIKLGGILLGIDADLEALEFAKKRFRDLEIKRSRDKEDDNPNLQISKSPSLFQIVRGNFRDIEKIAGDHGFDQVNGIIFDLGVSSHQLDTPRRGFSYRWADSPLDLRFDQGQGETAADLLQRLSQEELYEILAKFGEEKLARAIAVSVVGARKIRPIQTTGQLAWVISRVVRPKRELPSTLSRVFQALRIVVNDELARLGAALVGAGNLVVPGGRLAVVSFHSLEDRLVKKYVKGPGWKVIAAKPIRPSRAEIAANIRARSAKLRLAQKI